jgi:GWxTD domain-containing protein
MRVLKIYFFLLLSLLWGCNVGFELSQQNLCRQYDPEYRFSKPEFLIYHENDSISVLGFQLNWSDLQYSRKTTFDKFKAALEVSFYLYENYESRKILDSATRYYSDSTGFGAKQKLKDFLFFHATIPGEYVLKINLLDMNSGKELNYDLPVSKKSFSGNQSFKLLDHNNNLIFRNFVSGSESVTLQVHSKQESKLFGKYFKRNFPIASPPFVLEKDKRFDYKPDSTFAVDLNDGFTPPLQFEKEGFYFFQTDSLTNEGYTIYKFYDDFPEISSADHIITPLRYISTQHEYDILTNSTNKKLTADSFWLVNTGHPNRAKQLISKYYNRVKEANDLFSSYFEGWKTDRGMVYIVFGPPNYVYKITNSETWVYGEAGNPSSLRFSFVKVINPFTQNDYSLYRNPMFKESWYNSVENWRR